MLKIPTGGRQTSWLQSMALDLNAGLPLTKSERDLNEGPPDYKSGALKPLGHGTSLINGYKHYRIKAIRSMEGINLNHELQHSAGFYL